MHAFLKTWFTASPFDRLAAAFLHYGAGEEGARFFMAYDRWIAIMQNPSARDELRCCAQPTEMIPRCGIRSAA